MGIPVKLQAFEGPLDLLLHLIDKNKMNIFDIPIAEITEQYMDYIRAMESKDMEVMSEFLVMAATLLRLKSQLLLPQEKKEEEEASDPRAELVERLLEYKLFKYASFQLKDMQSDAEYMLYKEATIPKELKDYREEMKPEELLAGITLPKLQRIFEAIIKRQEDKVDPIRSKFGTIEKEAVSLSEKIVELQQYGLRHRVFRFRALFYYRPAKMDVIVTFLGVLELMKMGRVLVRQEELFDDIELEYLAEDVIAVEEFDV